MADKEHFENLQKGVESWNKWRLDNPAILPDLSGANLLGANLNKANLSGANLSRANLSRAYLWRADLSGAYLWRAYLIGVDLSGANLSGADLSGTDLGEAKLDGANLNEINLSGAYLFGVALSKADLSNANLSGANLSNTVLWKAKLIGAKLFGTDFSETNLSYGNLWKADLSEADLSRADLIGTDFSEADLSEAKLIGAKLIGAKLIGADLSRADLSRANLSEADLLGANLNKANLSKTIINEYTVYRGIKGCQVGVNGIWSESEPKDSAALAELTPPGNSMQGPNPNAVIESLKRARRLHGYSMSIAGIILLIEVLSLPKILFPYTEGVEVTPDRFGLLAMPISIALLSLVNTFMADALKGTQYLQDRQSAMTVGNFPWTLSKYAGGRQKIRMIEKIQSLIDKTQSLIIRFVMSFHPLIYIYLLGEWKWNVFPRVAFYILSALSLIFSGWTFYLSHRFQRPILFDRRTEEEYRDNLTKLTEAVQAQTKVVTELVDILKPKQVDNFSNTNGRNNNH